ncbi:MAG: hypothetical protein PHE29_12515, partial [Tissierellia bacterium]|nr:hypothetical protein [Tissierellia bacterium]
MESDNLKEMLKFLNIILNEQKYAEDKGLIKKTSDEISDLLVDENQMNDTTLELIKHNINYLDRKYDDLYNLTNLYDPVYIGYKKQIHNKYVAELRKRNKKKREGN